MKNCPKKQLFYISILLLIPVLIGLNACDNTAKVSEQLLTKQEKQAEKLQIIETLNTYIQAANDRN